MRSGLPAQLNFLPEPTENGYFFANSRAFQYRVAHGLTVAVNHSVSYHQGEISGLNVAGADLRFQVAQGFREVAPRAAASLRVISQLFEHALVAEVVKYRGRASVVWIATIQASVAVHSARDYTTRAAKCSAQAFAKLQL
jgi:hypothetical protein